jgi:calcineurin-like phosphoesterase family protein
MIKIDKEIDVWITSDTHYNHKNICRGTTSWDVLDGVRNFSTLEEMNNTIVSSINKCVKENDILIHLGDFSFGGFQSISEFYNQLNCKNIHYILGNHDTHIETNRENIQSLFKSVSYYETLKYCGYTFKLFHYPIQSWDGLGNGVIHLHGHTHLPNERKFGNGRKMDVGMDGHIEFRPYNLKNEIIPLLSQRDISSDLINDHHVISK